jgi:hypothetical protein
MTCNIFGAPLQLLPSWIRRQFSPQQTTLTTQHDNMISCLEVNVSCLQFVDAENAQFHLVKQQQQSNANANANANNFQLQCDLQHLQSFRFVSMVLKAVNLQDDNPMKLSSINTKCLLLKAIAGSRMFKNHCHTINNNNSSNSAAKMQQASIPA